MQLTITDVDDAPQELYEQVPIVVDLLRQIVGDDRPDYWIGRLRTPIRWMVDNQVRHVTHVVVAARWQDTAIQPGARSLPINIAYVTDDTLLSDNKLNFNKCAYVAIGTSFETTAGGEPVPSDEISAGTIARAFGMGNKQ